MYFDIKWIDRGREPQVAPNPAFPHGVDLDGSTSGEPWCKTALSYPARRCGLWLIECKLCGVRVLVTTAGRPDDPRSIKVACLPMARA